MEHGEILEFLPPSEEVCSVLVVEAVSLCKCYSISEPFKAQTLTKK